jgi:hypothetical protein
MSDPTITFVFYSLFLGWWLFIMIVVPTVSLWGPKVFRNFRLPGEGVFGPDDTRPVRVKKTPRAVMTESLGWWLDGFRRMFRLRKKITIHPIAKAGARVSVIAVGIVPYAVGMETPWMIAGLALSVVFATPWVVKALWRTVIHIDRNIGFYGVAGGIVACIGMGAMLVFATDWDTPRQTVNLLLVIMGVSCTLVLWYGIRRDL